MLLPRYIAGMAAFEQLGAKQLGFASCHVACEERKVGARMSLEKPASTKPHSADSAPNRPATDQTLIAKWGLWQLFCPLFRLKLEEEDKVSRCRAVAGAPTALSGSILAPLGMLPCLRLVMANHAKTRAYVLRLHS